MSAEGFRRKCRNVLLVLFDMLDARLVPIVAKKVLKLSAIMVLLASSRPSIRKCCGNSLFLGS